MPVNFEGNEREPITTVSQLWRVLGNHASSGREFQRESITSYVAVGQAMLWNELAWVIVHDDLYVKSRELGLALKWQPVGINDSKLVPNHIYMRNEQIITPRVVGAVLGMANYVLDNTNFGDLGTQIEDGIAALWGFAPIVE